MHKLFKVIRNWYLFDHLSKVFEKKCSIADFAYNADILYLAKIQNTAPNRVINADEMGMVGVKTDFQ